MSEIRPNLVLGKESDLLLALGLDADSFLNTALNSISNWNLIGKEFQFGNFLAMKRTTQHDLYK